MLASWLVEFMTAVAKSESVCTVRLKLSSTSVLNHGRGDVRARWFCVGDYAHGRPKMFLVTNSVTSGGPSYCGDDVIIQMKIFMNLLY